MPLQVTTQCTNGQLHLKKAGRERSEGEICDSIELLWWCCAERSAFNARPTSDPYARFSLTHYYLQYGLQKYLYPYRQP